MFTVRSDLMKSRVTGRQHTVDQLLAPDWVNVVAITAENDMLFVKQWRFGARAFTLEIPEQIKKKPCITRAALRARAPKRAMELRRCAALS